MRDRDGATTPLCHRCSRRASPSRDLSEYTKTSPGRDQNNVINIEHGTEHRRSLSQQQLTDHGSFPIPIHIPHTMITSQLPIASGSAKMGDPRSRKIQPARRPRRAEPRTATTHWKSWEVEGSNVTGAVMPPSLASARRGTMTTKLRVVEMVDVAFGTT